MSNMNKLSYLVNFSSSSDTKRLFDAQGDVFERISSSKMIEGERTGLLKACEY
jgi:hypothetical protein